MGVRPGVRIALDWGKTRIGVAACDPQGMLAYPVTTIPAKDKPFERIKQIVAEYEPIEVLVGLPVDLRGEMGPAARAIMDIAYDLSQELAPIPVCLVDERLSTAEASRKLAAVGKDSRARRRIIDQEAAVGILTHALDAELGSGRRPMPVPDRKEDQ